MELNRVFKLMELDAKNPRISMAKINDLDSSVLFNAADDDCKKEVASEVYHLEMSLSSEIHTVFPN